MSQRLILINLLSVDCVSTLLTRMFGLGWAVAYINNVETFFPDGVDDKSLGLIFSCYVEPSIELTNSDIRDALKTALKDVDHFGLVVTRAYNDTSWERGNVVRAPLNPKPYLSHLEDSEKIT